MQCFMCAGMRKERFQDTMIDVVIDTIDGKVMLEMCLRLEATIPPAWNSMQN